MSARSFSKTVSVAVSGGSLEGLALAGAGFVGTACGGVVVGVGVVGMAVVGLDGVLIMWFRSLVGWGGPERYNLCRALWVLF